MAFSLKCEDVARSRLGEPAECKGAELHYRCVYPERHANTGIPMLSGGDGRQHG
jgi:hypothetical protein